jgi:hypothetical protein
MLCYTLLLESETSVKFPILVFRYFLYLFEPKIRKLMWVIVCGGEGYNEKEGDRVDIDSARKAIEIMYMVAECDVYPRFFSKALPQMRGKIGKSNPKESRDRHVGRKPSKLTAKLTLGLRLQVLKLRGGGLQIFKLWG